MSAPEPPGPPTAEPVRSTRAPARTHWGVALSWCLHDLANTIYSAVVVTVFLPLLTVDRTGLAWPAGLTGTASMIAAAFVVPVLGGLLDRTGRAKAWLVRTYTAYALLAVGMSVAAAMPGGIWGVLGLFAAANFLYQASLVLYNSLLPVVAAPANRGLVSGLGVGLGYLGMPLAFGLAYLVVQWAGVGWTFALAGVLVLAFSIPLQVWVPERVVDDPQPIGRGVLRREYGAVREILREVAGTPRLRWFFLGNFLCVDVLNTAILWTGTYLVKGIGMSEGEMLLTLVVANLSAFVVGCGLGWFTDRLGGKPTYLIAALCLLVALVLLSTTSDPWVVRGALWSFGAAGLGGIWVAGRKLLLDLVPDERAGSFFGLYGLTNKGAAFGMVAFALIRDALGFRMALLFAALPLLVGIGVMSMVRAGRD